MYHHARTTPFNNSILLKTMAAFYGPYGFYYGHPPYLLGACSFSRMATFAVWLRYINRIMFSDYEEIQETTRQGWVLVELKAQLIAVLEMQLKGLKENMEAETLGEASDLVRTV